MGIDRINDVGPWFLVGTGTKIFNNRANIMTEALAPMLADEQGNLLDQGVTAWTGGHSTAGGDPYNCTNWTVNTEVLTDPGSSGGIGYPGHVNAWNDSGATTFCNGTEHLYCFEQ
jgi:hypothetical protein